MHRPGRPDPDDAGQAMSQTIGHLQTRDCLPNLRQDFGKNESTGSHPCNEDSAPRNLTKRKGMPPLVCFFQ